MNALDSGRARRTFFTRSAAFAIVPLAAAALLVPSVALAAGSTTTPTGKLAGCLKSDGTLVKVAQGGKPASKCKSKATKVVWNVKGPKGDAGPTGAKGDSGVPGVAGLETVTQVVGTDLLGSVGGPTSAVSIACPTGKSALSGGVVPSPASLLNLEDLLDGLLASLVPGAILNNVTTVIGSAPVPTGDAWSVVTPLTANAGDTFYAVCATAAP